MPLLDKSTNKFDELVKEKLGGRNQRKYFLVILFRQHI